MFFDTDGSLFFSPIRGGVNFDRNWGVNLTGIFSKGAVVAAKGFVFGFSQCFGKFNLWFK
jgi:hypothetical protein